MSSPLSLSRSVSGFRRPVYVEGRVIMSKGGISCSPRLGSLLLWLGWLGFVQIRGWDWVLIFGVFFCPRGGWHNGIGWLGGMDGGKGVGCIFLFIVVGMGENGMGVWCDLE